MPDSQDTSDEELKERFALSPFLDLEIDACGEGLVGISPDASHRLRQDVIASVIAAKLGYSSVDYVRKRYLNDLAEHPSKDEDLRALANRHELAYDLFYHAFRPPRSDAPLGVFAFDLAIVRARTSLPLLVSLSRQGFLLETALIARSLLEQFAYAAYVWDKSEDHEVFEVQPQTLIKHLVRIRPSAGRAYGLLSRLSHYNPKEHYQFIGAADGSSVSQRSWRFKIIGSAWTFYIFDVMLSVFKESYGTYDNFSQLIPLVGATVGSFDRYFSGISSYWVGKVRSLLIEAPG